MPTSVVSDLWGIPLSLWRHVHEKKRTQWKGVLWGILAVVRGTEHSLQHMVLFPQVTRKPRPFKVSTIMVVWLASCSAVPQVRLCLVVRALSQAHPFSSLAS